MRENNPANQTQKMQLMDQERHKTNVVLWEPREENASKGGNGQSW